MIIQSAMSGTETTPDPPTEGTEPSATSEEEPGTRTLRMLAGLLALALGFAAAVLIALAVDTADQLTREDCLATVGCAEYFDGEPAQKTATVALLGIGGGLGIVGVIVCLLVVAWGSGSRWMLPVTCAAILFGASGVVVANV